MTCTNALGQPVGAPLPDWTPPPPPAATLLFGRYCRLDPLDANRHGAALYAAFTADRTGANWTYLPYGPFANEAAFSAWIASVAGGSDPLFFAVIDGQGQAVGIVSYLRITPAHGCIEIGHLHFSEALKHTPAATEALWLLLREAFALGYRRVEWKCNALNAPSRRAAQRLGFSFEGVFRQANVSKGRNRDTAWYGMIDADWPALAAAFDTWLAPGNFDAAGHQRASLSALTRPLLVAVG
ncbi:N-acetyltransferase [Zoogloea oryzae]|uniref:N-acetyltransferase n=1 Tax=Zoogloea oryzae TaxID=310767 RepID=A0ABQ6FJZ3_9RHOO|nr:GNAT family protein [Zoogloea oryzae]GLT24571.1 N-acetyltransferase [Zoogloea oryzae]